MLTVLSGLTITARCLLTAGVAAAICGIILNERDLVRIALFIIALPLISAASMVLFRPKITVTRQLSAIRVPVGSQTEIRLTQTMPSRFSLGQLYIEDTIPASLSGRTQTVVAIPKARFLGSVGYFVQARIRGIHQLGPARIKFSDPLGLVRYHRELGERTRLVVTPTVVRLHGLPVTFGKSLLGGQARRLGGGHGEHDASIRAYRSGDEPRTVHWRSSARQDELMVKVMEQPTQGVISVLLDTRTSAHTGTGATASFEWAVSLAASVCLHLIQQQKPVRLLNEQGVELISSSSARGQHGEHFLDVLATIRTNNDQKIALRRLNPASDIIAIFGTLSSSALTELLHYRPGNAARCVVALDTAQWQVSSNNSEPEIATTTNLLRTAGWTTVTAGPHQTLAEVWSILCTGVSPQSNGTRP